MKDWGGKVNNSAQNILSITEKMFKHKTKNFVFKTNELKSISKAAQNTKLRSSFDNLDKSA